MRKLVPAVLAAGLLAVLAAQSADAGQVVSATGPLTVNGRQATAAQPIALKKGDRVATAAGVTAVFRSDGGDEIRLEPNTSFRHEGVENGVEYMFVERGTGTGAVSGKTTLGCATGWATAPEGARAEVRVEVPAETATKEGRIRSLRGQTWFRNGDQAFSIPANHSITITNDAKVTGDAMYRTSQQNEGDVTIRRTVSGGNILVRVPRATSGAVNDHSGGEKSRFANDITSNKSGKLMVTTDFGERASAAIGPGTFALINNLTGSIETFLETQYDDLGDDVSDFDPVEDAPELSTQRRGKR